jgi:spore maturation protein CgeB
MKILCVLSRYAYGDPARGENYDHAHFVPALTSLGHEVEVFDSGDKQSYSGFAALNAALVAKIAAFQPDVIFTVLMHYEIWLETLDLIRATSRARIVNWGTDDSWKFRQASRYFARHVDLHVTTDAESVTRAAALGLDNVMLSQWAASRAQLQEPLPSSECAYDVTFVGNLYGDRAQWIGALRQAGIDVQCFGHGTEHGVVPAQKIPDLYRRSRISLGFTGAGDGALWFGASGGQIKARTFEVPGAGGFLLSQGASGIDRYYTAGEEIATFVTPDELTAQVRYYLANPQQRDAIAQAGHRRTSEQHTYDIRFADILERLSRCVPAPALASPSLTEATERHRIGVFLGGLRRALVGLMTAMFGAARGPRAARRFVYELSWRLVGEGTYRAAGWPGRLFFRES